MKGILSLQRLMIEILNPGKDYELIDSGDGEKLERFGDVLLSRPDPQALWQKSNSEIWKKAVAVYERNERVGAWKFLNKKDESEIKDSWTIDFGGLKLKIKPTPFKHTGLFPEQKNNWLWLEDVIKNDNDSEENTEIEVLNLFAYTGGASLACAKAGAKVVHIDSSNSAMTWARENAELSGLEDKPIRWILEDVKSFVDKELKRGRKYDGIIMDPPAFGHGTKKEIWKIEQNLMPLIEKCFLLLKDKPKFFLLNGYSAGYSPLAYNNLLLPLKEKFGGNVENGELTIKESGEKARLLSCGIFARWKK